MQDVLNRPTKTDLRGRVYLHADGPYTYSGVPDFGDRPLPVIAEFNRQMNQIEELEAESRFIRFPEHGIRVEIKNEDAQEPETLREYNLLARIYNHFRKTRDVPFFVSDAIIGHADLVDVTHSSHSIWAEDKMFHWVFASATLYTHPITGVRNRNAVPLWEWEPPHGVSL
ncbi:MAG: hypothetical protein EA383_05050 [Spirochaetaceae bacterium]|nr:MAG: hypothetical protein EA383_05050 [Spirochaetaceae bacterium]